MTTESTAPKLDFADAIRALKAGQRVARDGWNGKGMWLILAASSIAAVREHGPDRHSRLVTLPHIVMKTAQAQYVPWLASQTDMLADDWVNLDAPAAAAQPTRYTSSDIDDLRWATGLDVTDPLGERVNVWARMKDGKEFRGAFTPILGERIGPAAAAHALRIANGEQP